MIQFNSLLDQLGKEVEWEIQLTLLPVTGKLDDKTAHPLHPRAPSKEGRAHLNSTDTIGGFVGKLNKLGKLR